MQILTAFSCHKWTKFFKLKIIKWMMSWWRLNFSSSLSFFQGDRCNKAFLHNMSSMRFWELKPGAPFQIHNVAFQIHNVDRSQGLLLWDLGVLFLFCFSNQHSHIWGIMHIWILSRICFSETWCCIFDKFEHWFLDRGWGGGTVVVHH